MSQSKSRHKRYPKHVSLGLFGSRDLSLLVSLRHGFSKIPCLIVRLIHVHASFCLVCLKGISVLSVCCPSVCLSVRLLFFANPYINFHEILQNIKRKKQCCGDHQESFGSMPELPWRSQHFSPGFFQLQSVELALCCTSDITIWNSWNSIKKLLSVRVILLNQITLFLIDLWGARILTLYPVQKSLFATNPYAGNSTNELGLSFAKLRSAFS